MSEAQAPQNKKSKVRTGCLSCLTVLLLLIGGCFAALNVNNITYKYEDFKAGETQTNTAYIRLGLGSDWRQQSEKVSIKGNPYSLWLDVQPASENISEVILQKLVLVSRETGEEIDVTDHFESIRARVELNRKGQREADWHCYKVRLAYVPYDAFIQVQLINEDGSQEDIEVTISLELDYREERSNRTLDMIMSV